MVDHSSSAVVQVYQCRPESKDAHSSSASASVRQVVTQTVFSLLEQLGNWLAARGSDRVAKSGSGSQCVDEVRGNTTALSHRRFINNACRSRASWMTFPHYYWPMHLSGAKPMRGRCFIWNDTYGCVVGLLKQQTRGSEPSKILNWLTRQRGSAVAVIVAVAVGATVRWTDSAMCRQSR
jgi:hypothetical protein